MLTVVRVQDAGKIGEAAEKGADVIVVEKADAGKLKSAMEKAGGASVGVMAGDASLKDVSALREAGADFIVLEPDSALAEATTEEKIGVVLSVGLDADETDLRILGDLSPDSLLAPSPNGRLTLRNALKLRRTAGLTRTPLLIPADPGIDGPSLQALRDAGVVGIVVDSSDVGKLDKLKETILKLRPRGRRREEHQDATISVGAGDHEDEDDDWDD